LFDDYRAFRLEPAALWALPVVRRPAPGIATVLGGGFVASGPVGADRLPQPALPRGLRLLRAEGAGEVQTPVRGRAADQLRIGDRVWFRHAKAGELCEHVDVLHLLDGHEDLAITETVPTYRGEGRTFL
jgi:D-serine deaminase-like pyridoxal phosphate-dependent protein